MDSDNLSNFIDFIYGALPPKAQTSAVLLHSAPTNLLGLGDVIVESWRVNSATPLALSFNIRILKPKVTASTKNFKFPVIISGDACWAYITDEVQKLIINNNFAFVSFNRVEIAPDCENINSSTLAINKNALIYKSYPLMNFGALSAWAWAYSRVVDVIIKMVDINPLQIIITGHSRGGKSALIAGATDTRITLTHSNNSGCLGSGSNIIQNQDAETWQVLAKKFPHWISNKLLESLNAKVPNKFINAQNKYLNIDQDVLLSAILPRALLITQAEDDLWANPMGTKYLFDKITNNLPPSATNKIKFVGRNGGHPLNIQDWLELINFAKSLNPDSSIGKF